MAKAAPAKAGGARSLKSVIGQRHRKKAKKYNLAKENESIVTANGINIMSA
jgi:hypothetical protein